ncbi:hypothetical protein GCM10009801_82010 [Streptomyces albiaxialis]|uniref:Uncharacterized protein n=1 Tax=Streptomyces albiaxialis TaxID=329523 RepID=A0ABP5IVN1_9ACTN
MSAGWCTWHQGQAADVALIEVIEQGSGPGGGAYACLACADHLLSHRMLNDHARRAIAALKKRSRTAAAAPNGTTP